MKCQLCQRSYAPATPYEQKMRAQRRVELTHILLNAGVGEWPDEICVKCLYCFEVYVRNHGGWANSFDVFLANRLIEISFPSRAPVRRACSSCGGRFLPRATELRCIECMPKSHKDVAREWRKKNKDRIREYFNANKHKYKKVPWSEMSDEYKDRHKARQREAYRLKNLDKVIACTECGTIVPYNNRRRGIGHIQCEVCSSSRRRASDLERGREYYAKVRKGQKRKCRDCGCTVARYKQLCSGCLTSAKLTRYRYYASRRRLNVSAAELHKGP